MPPLSYTGNEILLQTHFLRLMPHTSDFHWGVFRPCLKRHSFRDRRRPDGRGYDGRDARCHPAGKWSVKLELGPYTDTTEGNLSTTLTPPPVPHASVWIGPGGNHPAVRRSIMFGQYRTQTPQGKPLGVPYPHRSCPGTTHKPRQRVVPPQGGMNTAVHWK